MRSSVTSFCLVTFFIFVHQLSSVETSFTSDFSRFLKKIYGKKGQQALERRDWNGLGSFGGKIYVGEKTSKQAIIFVHGLSMHAYGFQDVRQFFLNKGYKNAELYATTWSRTDASAIFETDMKCEYVQQVRRLIMAVHKYTGRKVDVIGYSMGCPISRKAILGGKCAESDENIGAPLTKMVDTFIGIAGTNYGANLCHLRLFGDTCGKVIGLDCSSKFLSDINGQKRKYEGSHVFSIYSTKDKIAGYKVCGKKHASTIPNQDKGFKRTGNHDQVLRTTTELQYSLVKHHKGV